MENSFWKERLHFERRGLGKIDGSRTSWGEHERRGGHSLGTEEGQKDLPQSCVIANEKKKEDWQWEKADPSMFPEIPWFLQGTGRKDKDIQQ